MSIVNGTALLKAAPMSPMVETKQVAHGVSYGMSFAGYDLRIRQDVTLTPENRFTLASTIERFQMPACLVGIVHDKSTWARQGLSVFNTVIEPGWHGDALTLELVYHGNDTLHIAAGAGIAQVLFHPIEEPAQYAGKYQWQASAPVPAILEGTAAAQEGVQDGINGLFPSRWSPEAEGGSTGEKTGVTDV